MLSISSFDDDWWMFDRFNGRAVNWLPMSHRLVVSWVGVAVSCSSFFVSDWGVCFVAQHVLYNDKVLSQITLMKFLVSYLAHFATRNYL